MYCQQSLSRMHWKEREGRERERENMKATNSRPVEVIGIFITTDECRQNLKEGVQSVQDICAGNPGLGRFQLSPPPVAVSIASVW